MQKAAAGDPMYFEPRSYFRETDQQGGDVTRHLDLHILHLQNPVIYSAFFKTSLNSAVKTHFYPIVPVSSHNFILHTCTFFLFFFFPFFFLLV